jgi:glycosyltransferase involved in cell wall biosynthesis
MRGASVSIIICTLNRADRLRQTLPLFDHLDLTQEKSIELIVVDNGSTDHTRQVVESFNSSKFRVRYFAETARGLSCARNTGLALATGQWIAFTDDDVEVTPTWLTELLAPIRAGVADATTGRIELADNLKKPWFKPLHRQHLADSTDGNPRPMLIGASMAFDRRVLLPEGNFDPHLGSGASGAGEDSAFSEMLRGRGFRLLYVEDAVVIHHPGINRTTRASFLKSAGAWGRTVGFTVWRTQADQIRFPTLRLLSCRLRLLAWRAAHLNIVLKGQEIPEREMVLVQWVHHYQEFATQKRRAASSKTQRRQR